MLIRKKLVHICFIAKPSKPRHYVSGTVSFHFFDINYSIIVVTLLLVWKPDTSTYFHNLSTYVCVRLYGLCTHLLIKKLKSKVTTQARAVFYPRAPLLTYECFSLARLRIIRYSKKETKHNAVCAQNDSENETESDIARRETRRLLYVRDVPYVFAAFNTMAY